MSRDEMDGRIWTEHQPHLLSSIAHVVHDIMDVSRRLTAHHFEAPWQTEKSRRSNRSSH